MGYIFPHDQGDDHGKIQLRCKTEKYSRSPGQLRYRRYITIPRGGNGHIAEIPQIGSVSGIKSTGKGIRVKEIDQ